MFGNHSYLRSDYYDLRQLNVDGTLSGVEDILELADDRDQLLHEGFGKNEQQYGRL